MSLLLEQAILNQCLTVSGAADEAMAVLRKSDMFAIPDHQKIYAAICEVSRQGIESDVIAVNSLLMEQHGNHSLYTVDNNRNWLEILLDLMSSGDTLEGAISSLTHRCYLLIEHTMNQAMQRVLLAGASELQRPGADVLRIMGGIVNRVEQYKGRLLELKDEPFAKALDRVAREAEEAGKRGDAITGIRTGLNKLDEYIKGLHPATLTILAGRPAVGKTAQLCQMAYNIAYGQQIPAAIFSLEMSTDQLARRFLALDTLYKNAQVLSGMAGTQPLEMSRVYDASGRIGQSPLYVRDNVYDLDSLKTEVKRLVHKYDVKVVFVDYLQLVEAQAPNRREMTGKVSRGLKLLSKDLKIPVVALAQLARDVDRREDKRPIKSDLKESGDLEQDADNIIFQYRDSYYASVDEPMPEDELENIIAKNRNGSTHRQGESIKFWLDLPTNRVADYQPRSF